MVLLNIDLFMKGGVAFVHTHFCPPLHHLFVFVFLNVMSAYITLHKVDMACFHFIFLTLGELSNSKNDVFNN